MRGRGREVVGLKGLKEAKAKATLMALKREEGRIISVSANAFRDRESDGHLHSTICISPAVSAAAITPTPESEHALLLLVGFSFSLSSFASAIRTRHSSYILSSAGSGCATIAFWRRRDSR